MDTQHENTHPSKTGSALVVGGGIGGMQAALDLTAAGVKVYLADNKASVGGVMAQLDKTFPTDDCAMCNMAPRLVELGRNPDVEKITLAEVESLTGDPGNFSVTLKKQPRFVDEDKCTGCGACVASCPTWNSVQPLEPTRVALDPGVEVQVREILKKHEGRQGPLMPILQEINERFQYFPEPILRYVSQETGHPLADLYRIATFYSSFSIVPRGKHVINVCMGTTCYVKGSQRLLETFSSLLGIGVDQTTPDRQFTLKSLRCIGCCGLAPAVMVGEKVYGSLTVQEVPEIVREYRTAPAAA